MAPTLAEPATRTYDELEPTEPEWTRWTGAHALRRRAREHGDRTFLIAPEEGVELPFAEVLETSERVAGDLRAAGAGRGDRVVIMGRNSSRFDLTWFATALGDLVEAPINTAYEGEFLRHQVELVQRAGRSSTPTWRTGSLPSGTAFPSWRGSGSSIRAIRTRRWPGCARPAGGRAL